MKRFWQEALKELRNHRQVFLVFVARCTQGSPGTPQSRMLVKSDGSQIGTVGGGIMEQNILKRATAALQLGEFAPELSSLAHRPNSSNASGLICGGVQTNVLALLKPERDLKTVAAIFRVLSEETPAAIRLTPSGIELIHDLDTPLYGSCLKEEDGSDWSYQLSTVNERRILVFGGGHCGQALAAQMLRLGYHVTLSDTRDKLVIYHDLSKAKIQLATSPAQTCKSVGPLWNQTAVVVMTHSYPSDVSALKEVIQHAPKFLGLMGSPPKLKRIYGELEAHGFSKSQLTNLRAPVGLTIGSDTPEEIAVSIAAQLIQEEKAHAIHEPNFAHHFSS